MAGGELARHLVSAYGVRHVVLVSRRGSRSEVDRRADPRFGSGGRSGAGAGLRCGGSTFALSEMLAQLAATVPAAARSDSCRRGAR